MLPDKAQETPQEGIVVAVGPGKPLAGGGFYEMTVKPEDRILFKPFPGPDIMVEDEKFVVMAEDRVLVILKG